MIMMISMYLGLAGLVWTAEIVLLSELKLATHSHHTERKWSSPIAAGLHKPGRCRC